MCLRVGDDRAASLQFARGGLGGEARSGRRVREARLAFAPPRAASSGRGLRPLKSEGARAPGLALRALTP